MQQVSRKLLLAGVLAFGTLTAACGDKVTLTQVQPFVGVQSVSVSPQNATINVGTTIALAASVTADATTAKTVSWTTSNAAVATVDQTGKVTGVSAGTVTIIATATADVSKTAGAAIVVNSGPIIPLQNPTIAINSVTDVNGNPVNLSNTTGQVNVAINTSGGGLIEAFLSTSCTTNTISSTDVAVASQTASSAQAGTVTLSFNTAQLNAAGTAPRFPNGNYCVKARLTNGTSVVVATNTQPVTLNNVNQFKATLAFVSQTGGPTSAVSSINGLNYNQGQLTATLNPVIFSSASPVALISGYLTRNGEQVGGASPGQATFTNAAVTSGVATIVFTDTTFFPAIPTAPRSIAQYTSKPEGDTLYITSATDAAGNPIAVSPSPAVVVGGAAVRIDNDIPNNAATLYSVNAPNGYIGAAYAFSSGTTGTAAADTRGGVSGVGGVTTTYYVGTSGSAAFATANSCTVTGLTAATVGTDLANTTATNIDAAKVIVKDALGNQVCKDVPVTTLLGVVTSFGVDKIAPNVVMTTSNAGAADLTGYNVSKNFSFIYNDTISGFGNTTSPLKGTLTKNFFTAGTSAAGDCVIGTYSATAKTCSATTITTTTTSGTPPNVVNSIEFTNLTSVPGYYKIVATVTDLAGNVSGTVTRLAAFDNVAPAIAGLTQAPSAVPSFGTVTVSGTATDNLDLTSTKGNLTYANAPLPFQGVAGTSFGPNFDATTVVSGAASVALPNVYRGLQSVAGGVIQANTSVPVASVTVTDVGTNVSPAATLTIATTTAATNVLAGNSFTATPTSGAPATSQATTALTINVGGLVADPAFQNQPFAQVDIYKVVSGELVLVGSNSTPSVTDQGANRTYTYTASGVALTAAATNTFYVIGRTAAGDAVISSAVTVVNP